MIELVLGLHGATSIASGIALLVAIGSLTMAGRASLNAGSFGCGIPTLARFGPCAVAVQLTSSLLLVTAIALNTFAGVAGRLELSTEAGCLALLAFSLTRGYERWRRESRRGRRETTVANAAPPDQQIDA